jgi:hypothetical protein
MTLGEGPEDIRRVPGITVSVGEGGPSLTICKTCRSVEKTGLPERFSGSRTASSSVFGVQVLSGAAVDRLSRSGLVLLECETIDNERGSVSVLQTGLSTLCPGWV